MDTCTYDMFSIFILQNTSSKQHVDQPSFRSQWYRINSIYSRGGAAKPYIPLVGVQTTCRSTIHFVRIYNNLVGVQTTWQYLLWLFINRLGYYSLHLCRPCVRLGPVFSLIYIIKWNFLSVCVYPNISRNTARTALKQTPKIR